MAVKKPSGSARRPLAVNVKIDGEWYGPAYDNAEDYPDSPDLEDPHFDQEG